MMRKDLSVGGVVTGCWVDAEVEENGVDSTGVRAGGEEVEVGVGVVSRVRRRKVKSRLLVGKGR